MRTFACLAFAILLCACRPDRTVYGRYRALDGETWKKYQAVEFRCHIPDSGLYRITLCLRHTDDCRLANLWCLLSTRSTLRSEFHDTLDFHLTGEDGQWLGQGRALRTLELEIPGNPVRLPAGDLVFRLQHGMPFDQVRGIRDVGIKIFKNL